MLYILWGLLNIGLFLFFIGTCFKATKLLRDKVGFLSSFIFILGLFLFIVHSNNNRDNKKSNSNQIKTWQFASEDSLSRNATFLLELDLEKTVLATYTLGISYGKDQLQQMNIPISAYSSTSGFISGTNWKPISIMVTNTSDNNKFIYRVDGVMEWQLLGATIYSQTKTYQGFASTK